MKNKALHVLAMLLAACPVVVWAQAPKDGVYISDEDVKAVLKHSADTKRAIPDNTLRVIDMDKYQLGVAVIHRGAMGGGGGNAGRHRQRHTPRRHAASNVPVRQVPPAYSMMTRPKVTSSYRVARH